MAEVERCKIEEIGDKDNFTRPEVASDPEHDVGKDQKIVKDEMGSDVGCTSYEVLVGRVQMPDVPALQDQEDDPIDTCDDEIEGERSLNPSVLSPYCVAMMAVSTVPRRVEGIVEGCNNHKKP